jgi:hypothetical protein
MSEQMFTKSEVFDLWFSIDKESAEKAVWGINYKIDPRVPKGELWFIQGGEVVGKIKGCGDGD